MSHEEVFRKMSKAGFLFRTSDQNPSLSGRDRAALVRRGNEFFNSGNFVAAKRVYMTAGYGDGLIRMGDHYLKNKEFLEAFRMYWLGKEKKRSGELIEKMVFVVREWLHEEAPKA
ncbi:MAG: hypothetical protein LBT33_06165 [Spirochaetia bacterium]|jgi:hypothetical protein|nr:hypothetical protein [Spirochaetia bacterium]